MADDVVEQWEKDNAQRIALIEKDYRRGLDEGEKAELARLQQAVQKAIDDKYRVS